MKTYHVLLAVLMLWAAVVQAQDEPLNRFEAYPLGSADLKATEEIIRAIVGKDGTVVVDVPNNRLLVIATDDEHTRIGGVIQQVDTPPMNVRIDVQFKGKSSSVETDIGVRGRGGLVITDGDVHSRIELSPRLKHQTIEASSDVTQTLLVGSGREASLHVGEQVPYPEWFVDYGMRWGIIHQHIEWKDVGAKLIVTPTVIGKGPMVSVRLTPELSGLVDGSPFNVRFVRAATQVTVRDGETLQLGGLGKDEDFYSKFLIGMDRSKRAQKMDILLTPHIMDPSTPQGGF